MKWRPPASSCNEGCSATVGYTLRQLAFLCLVTARLYAVFGVLGTSDAATTVKLSGRVSVLDTHTQVTWFLSTGLSMFDPASRTYQLPAQPAAAGGAGVKAGDWAELTCTLQANDPLACGSVSGVKEALPPGGSDPGFSAAGAAKGDITLLVHVVSFTPGPGCPARPAGYSVQDVTGTLFGAGGVAELFAKCSYGKTEILQTKSKVLATPVPCASVFELRNCGAMQIAQAAGAKAAQLLSQSRDSPSEYNRHMFIMPQGTLMSGTQCGWAGLAAAPGYQTWLQSNSLGFQKKGTIMQELLHNYGLQHSYRGGVEYEDHSTCMGRGDVCPNAYEIGRLRWAYALAVLTKDDLPIGRTVSFTLPATYLGPTDAFLKIQPDWLGGGWIQNIYMALRARGGGDKDLDEEFNQKLNIHTVDRQIDDNPDSPLADDPHPELIRLLASGTPEDMVRFKLKVTSGRLLEGGTKLEVTLCRYSADPDQECRPAASKAPVIAARSPVQPSSSRSPSPRPPFPRPPSPRPSTSPQQHAPKPQGPSSAQCPVPAGYRYFASQNAPNTALGTDLQCAARGTMTAPDIAKLCAGLFGCKAFAMHSAGDTLQYCLKTATGPTTAPGRSDMMGPCEGLYMAPWANGGNERPSSAQCPVPAGYRYFASQDAPNTDLQCAARGTMTAPDIAKLCAGMPGCKAFGMHDAGEKQYCLKTAAGPTTAPGKRDMLGPCEGLYVALSAIGKERPSSAQCPVPAGYRYFVSQNAPFMDLQCAARGTMTAPDIAKLCAGMFGCNSFGMHGAGEKQYCLKTATGPNTAPGQWDMLGPCEGLYVAPWANGGNIRPSSAQCPVPAGYRYFVSQNAPYMDLQCAARGTMTAPDIAKLCAGMFGCNSFGMHGAGEKQYCLKTATGPITPPLQWDMLGPCEGLYVAPWANGGSERP